MGVSATAGLASNTQTLPVTPERLCEQYAPAVCRFAAMVAKTPTDAEDIAQEALLHAVRRLDSFDARRGTLDAWLWRIVANVAHDHGRAERRRVAIWTRLGELWDPHVASVESLALDSLDHEQLLDAVRRLQPRDRALLGLRFAADLDLRSVGQALGLSEGSAGRAVLRALDRLRALLEVTT